MNEIYFLDLVSGKCENMFNPMFANKLKAILEDLNKFESGLYNKLIKKNPKINVDELLSLLEFLGTGGSSSLDIEEILNLKNDRVI